MDIFRGIVKDVTDPENLGRIKIELIGFEADFNRTPFAWPCAPFAGPDFGFYFMPQIGDEVYATQDNTGRWIYIGFFWSGRNEKPIEGGTEVRILKTPAGHNLKFVESGEISINHANGSIIKMDASGNIEISGSGPVKLNGDGGNIVTTQSICSLTGFPHPQGSTKAKADM